MYTTSRTIYFDAPNVGALEKEYLCKAIDSGYVSSVGPFVTEFEDIFAKYLGSPKAVATQSGTSALYMALHELGIGPGDEVIVPALTFVATANPVIYLGATPVFVDADEKTWVMDITALQKSITSKTKAIMPVHLYGIPCDMDAIMDLARKHKLHVIEDATESLGAFYGDQHTGTIGDFGCFSFNGNKIITTGGGGMIVGKKPDQLKHIKYLINQAKGDESIQDQHAEIGFNHRMTNIEAAVGLAQMKQLEGFLEKKRRFSDIYHKELAGRPDIQFQNETNNTKSSWWCVCIRVTGKSSVEMIQARLSQAGVPTKRILKPVPDYKPYQKYGKNDCKKAAEIYESALALPTSTLNSEDDIKEVCHILKEVLDGR